MTDKVKEKGRLRQKIKSAISPPTESATEDFPELNLHSKSDYTRKYGTASIPLNKVFVEVEDGFKQVNQDALKQNKTNSENTLPKPCKENIFKNLAYSSHLYFHKFSTLCFGLFAGIAIWHCIVIFNLTSTKEWTDFMRHYSHLAYSYQSIFYFFNVICVISVLDRFDVSNKNWTTISSLYKQRNPIILTLLFYPVSLIITVSITDIDHLLASYKFGNETAWFKDMSELGIRITEKLEAWQWLTLVRTVLVSCGWCLIALQNEKDAFLQQLRDNA